MFVYVIYQHGGPAKVGVSNNVRTRLHQLQNANPLKLTIWDAIEVSDGDALTIEREAHWALREDRMLGEWFNCSPEAAWAAVQAAVGAIRAGTLLRPPRTTSLDGVTALWRQKRLIPWHLAAARIYARAYDLRARQERPDAYVEVAHLERAVLAEFGAAALTLLRAVAGDGRRLRDLIQSSGYTHERAIDLLVLALEAVAKQADLPFRFSPKLTRRLLALNDRLAA